MKSSSSPLSDATQIFDVYLTYINHRYTVVISALPPKTQLSIPRFIKRIGRARGKSYFRYTKKYFEHGDIFSTKIFKDFSNLYCFYKLPAKKFVGHINSTSSGYSTYGLTEESLTQMQRVNFRDSFSLYSRRRNAIYIFTQRQLIKSDLTALSKNKPLSYFLLNTLANNPALNRKVTLPGSVLKSSFVDFRTRYADRDTAPLAVLDRVYFISKLLTNALDQLILDYQLRLQTLLKFIPASRAIPHYGIYTSYNEVGRRVHNAALLAFKSYIVGLSSITNLFFNISQLSDKSLPVHFLMLNSTGLTFSFTNPKLPAAFTKKYNL